jgi:hypothetical protein
MFDTGAQNILSVTDCAEEYVELPVAILIEELMWYHPEELTLVKLLPPLNNPEDIMVANFPS